jgi:hypothetical protein
MINIKALLGLTYYISELDEFLTEYDKTHPKLSASQHIEVEKHVKIFTLRDHPDSLQPKEPYWDKF